MRGRIRWALFTAFLSVVLAVALGVAAFTYSEEEPAETANSGPIEGNYAFASTTIVLDTPFARSPEMVIVAGRLAIGADSHVFWSLQMHSKADASRTGRLTCEGTFDSDKRTVTPSPRYGYGDFAPDLTNPDMQRSIYEQFCTGAGGAGSIRPDNGPIDVVSQAAGVIELKGRGGVVAWRRE